MRILGITITIFYIFFCRGMDKRYLQGDNYNISNLGNQLPNQIMLSSQQAAIASSTAYSAYIAASIIAKLPQSIRYITVSEYAQSYENLQSCLSSLSSFLDTAFDQKLNIPINPIIYGSYNYAVTEQFFPIPVAIDFLHPPLLEVCKKYIPDFSQLRWQMNSNTTFNIFEKYTTKLQEVGTASLDCLKEKSINLENLSCCTNQLAKLAQISNILNKR